MWLIKAAHDARHVDALLASLKADRAGDRGFQRHVDPSRRVIADRQTESSKSRHAGCAAWPRGSGWPGRFADQADWPCIRIIDRETRPGRCGLSSPGNSVSSGRGQQARNGRVQLLQPRSPGLSPPSRAPVFNRLFEARHHVFCAAIHLRVLDSCTFICASSCLRVT